MSISSISSNADYYQNSSINGSASLKQQSQQDFKSLADSLQSGDLSGAQSAFAALLQLFPNSSSSVTSPTQSATAATTGSSSGTSSIKSDLSTLGQALQSNDLTDAQNDFSKLTQDIQSIAGVHHHHHHHKISASSQETTDASATGTIGSTNSVKNDLSALSEALESGDLKSAGDAYLQLTKDMQSTKPTANSNAGLQQLQNMLAQIISAGSSINVSA
jgi:hypothetical protein